MEKKQPISSVFNTLIRQMTNKEDIEALDRLSKMPEFLVLKRKIFETVMDQNQERILNYVPSSNSMLDNYNVGVFKGFYNLARFLHSIPEIVKKEKEDRASKEKKINI